MDSQNAALDQGLNVLISPVAERRPRERVAPSCSPDRSGALGRSRTLTTRHEPAESCGPPTIT